jgi:hypothetical protein
LFEISFFLGGEKMRKSILLAVVLVALVAMPAMASVQNVKVSGSVNSMFIHRANFDLGANSAGNEVQDIFATQTKLRVDANLTDNVDAVISLINERTWSASNSDDLSDDSNPGIDIDQAYVTLREMIYSPLTVKIGRQKLRYGNAFIMGDGNGLNSSGLNGVANDLSDQYGLDGIRMMLDYNPLTIDMFYAKYDANTVTLAANDRDDVDYYGVNATYNIGDEMQSQVEGYFFAKYDKNEDAGDYANDTVYTPGIRVSTNPLEGLNLQLEYAHQAGNKVDDANNNQKRNANAVQFISTYMVPALEEYNPILVYSYTRLSGDNDISAQENAGGLSGETYTAWDPMLNDQISGTIVNAILTKTSIQTHLVALQMNPVEDVTTKFQYMGVWLDKATHTGDVTYVPNLIKSPGSGTTSLAAATDEKHIGNEFDWITKWNYTEDVTVGANLGIFIPGKLLDGNNKDAATQAIFNVDVAF